MRVNKKSEIHANNDNVVRSPRLAAMGVATLSGLMFSRLDSTITIIVSKPI